MSGIATIGGGAASSFQPLAALQVNLISPPFDTYSYSITNSHLLANCARQAQQLRRRRHEPRNDGPNREGALFCRSGTWVQILDKTAAEYEARRNDLIRPEYIRGTRDENSRFSVLEFISVAFGLETKKEDETGKGRAAEAEATGTTRVGKSECISRTTDQE
ncbi:unnamed protein product [Anisakis simplex]|uniref:Uncharacterized protein n=1 Tax=Anisakis simplex TaxID=6269 RepID=A0A0M3K096_ANISI|nr:unnamed protein product [Anisakis simplex]